MTGRKIVETSVAASSTDSETIFVPSGPMVVVGGNGGGGEAVKRK
jgi:hypothetical protein